MNKFIVALIAATAAMSAAQAQTTTPRTYVGVGVASADHDYSNTGGLGVGNGDGYKASAKLFGGYEFNQTWGAEAGYTDFRNSSFGYNTGSAGFNGVGHTDGYGYYVAAKATAPVNDQFGLYGKLGLEHSQRSLKDAGLYNRSDSDIGAYAAVGLQYSLTPQVALTAEYERYGKQKDFGAKPDVWTVAARYSF